MKRWLALSMVLGLGIGALILGERRKANSPVSPAPVVNFISGGEREATRLPARIARLSDAEEIRIGDEMARNYSFRLMDNSAKADMMKTVEPYVQTVGIKVAARAHRKLPYRFHFIPDLDLINAFALPGGHVFIGAGLMALMDSEDELASVLGHEVEHIDHYHCAERAQTEAATRHIPLGGLVMLPMEVFQAGYSKDQELEADREGTHLAVWAGYSPLGAIRMFEKFDALYKEQVNPPKTPQEELSKVALQTLQDYFRSHPPTEERVAQIRALITDENWTKLPNEKPLAAAFAFETGRALQALQSWKFKLAVGLAGHSLKADPNQPAAIRIMADAEFALGNFATAASHYREHLERLPYRDELLYKYSDSLAFSGDPRSGARYLQSWLNTQKPLTLAPSTRVEVAGLILVAHSRDAASQKVVASLKGAVDGFAPELQGRWGWWNYRAGDSASAVSLLTHAFNQRPQNEEIGMELAWTLVEQKNYVEALNHFYSAPRAPGQFFIKGDRGIPPEPELGHAVAMWLSDQKDEAMKVYSGGVSDVPQWQNLQWLAKVYSPSVAKCVGEMQAEEQRRKEKSRSRVVH